MGSPSSRLKTQEQFRPWVDAGLEYVFSPGHAERAAEATQQAQQQQPHQPPAYQNHQPAPQAPQPTTHPVQQDQQQAPRPSRQQAQQVQQQPSTQPVDQSVTFPAPWDGFLARVKAKAPKVVCTYMELGLDLGGQPDRARGDVLRNTLTHHLKWPPGTAAFWPVAALANGALQPNPTMFWKGWELWHSPYIVCFGDEALRVIHPESERGATTCLLDHVTIYVVPPLAQLTTMLPHDQQLVIEQLLNIRF